MLTLAEAMERIKALEHDKLRLVSALREVIDVTELTIASQERAWTALGSINMTANIGLRQGRA